jgi:hypothetical protein
MLNVVINYETIQKIQISGKLLNLKNYLILNFIKLIFK